MYVVHICMYVGIEQESDIPDYSRGFIDANITVIILSDEGGG